ncbi:hypothetical protein HPB49_017378 [Dermacentor silvarum]|uniref:Uncharacterized protein n=1 Tax=Dermacentor silvarum TaxID=543639 RepID=A0ACB8C4M2_DERSI|nr:hypothetical protein HPB49_017378 [Dermacentor silvarum]
MPSSREAEPEEERGFLRIPLADLLHSASDIRGPALYFFKKRVLEEPALTSHSAMDGEATATRSRVNMTIRILVVFLSVMATLADHDVERSNERTNKDGYRVPAVPQQCVAESGQEGVCVLAKQCLKDGGVSLGRCTDGKMICCHRPEEEKLVKCGGVVNDNEVVFRSPDYPHQQAVYGQCQVTVHAREEVCQLRLDFSEFSLSPPETCGPRAGYCLDDAFSVSAGVESSSYPVLCGFNSGQHMYIDVSQSKQAVLSVRLSARTEMERRWSIRITQVACWSPTMAPEGCLQYHTKAADTITSFNFARNPTGFHYLANMHYSICIRRQLGFCSILFEENGANGFRLSPLVNQRCRDAYVLIPTGSTGTVTEGNLGDRICGTTFTPVAVPVTPIGSPQPVNLGAPLLNQTQFAGRQFADALVCRAGGFSLRYAQLPHGC